MFRNKKKFKKKKMKHYFFFKKNIHFSPLRYLLEVKFRAPVLTRYFSISKLLCFDEVGFYILIVSTLCKLPIFKILHSIGIILNVKKTQNTYYA